MASQLLLLLLGLGMLVAGGEGLIRGALAAGRRLRLPPLVAGLVIVGFGTSAPELSVSIDAALTGEPAVALGNVVGSNIGNIALILGLCAVIAPLPIAREALIRDGAVALAAALAFPFLARDGELGPADGAALLAMLAAYLGWTLRQEMRGGGPAAAVHDAEAAEIERLPERGWLVLLALAGGLALLVAGAHLTVRGALGVGATLGIPEAVIGLTVVAIGTSLPELTVSLVATLRRHVDVAVGNILGSNIFNLLGILGVSALLRPLPVDGRMARLDQWLLVAATAALVAFLATGHRIARGEGALLLCGYLAYLTTMAPPGTW